MASDTYYDSSVCQIDVLPDNSVKLQLKGQDDSPCSEAVFSIDQLRETAKFGNKINDILSNEPEKEVVDAVEKQWKLWRTFPGFTHLESEGDDGSIFAEPYNEWFSKMCSDMCSAIRGTNDIVSEANYLSLNDDKYYMTQLAKLKTQERFQKKWEGFIAELLPSQDTLTEFLNSLRPDVVEENYHFTSYPIGQILLDHYIRIIVMRQVSKAIVGSALCDDDQTGKHHLPSWTSLSEAYDKSAIVPPRSWMAASGRLSKLSRVVNVLAMLEHHLTPSVMADLSKRYQEAKYQVRYEKPSTQARSEETLAQDETFGHAVKLLKTIGLQFGFAPGKGAMI